MSVSQVTTQLRTTNIEESIEFYVSKLGFDVEFRYEDFYAGIKAGDQLFHLKLVGERDPSIDYVFSGDHFHLYFTTDDVVGKAKTLKDNGIEFIKPVNDTPWGTKEFSIRDNQGHVLYFGQIR
jgi:uncharacterized glyoxalase superfamily protein PhnB